MSSAEHTVGDIPIGPHPDIESCWTCVCSCGYLGLADAPESAVLGLAAHLNEMVPGQEGTGVQTWQVVV